MRSILGSAGVLMLLGLSVTATGCGDSEGSEVDGNGQGASSSRGGSIALGGNTNGTGGNGSGVVITPDAACATGTASAALSGVNMFVMFDRSSSMNEEANDDGDTRWQMASTALTSFFADPEAGGLKLALRFFPHDQPAQGCHGDDEEDNSCDVDACASPLVTLGTLTAEAAPADMQEQALLEATQRSAPGMAGQGTPISAALGGALQWAAAQRRATPTENSVVVLVTDGQANGCVQNINAIAELAADALAEDGIRTYAIGLTGSEEADMDRIAEAGGTVQGIFVADGANGQAELKAALGAIRGQVLDCDFPMPEGEPGVLVEPTLINVNYTPGGGAQSTLTQVGTADQCGTNLSWYYDDFANPSRIILCQSACDVVTADAAAKLDILLGCGTASEPPK